MSQADLSPKEKPQKKNSRRFNFPPHLQHVPLTPQCSIQLPQLAPSPPPMVVVMVVVVVLVCICSCAAALRCCTWSVQLLILQQSLQRRHSHREQYANLITSTKKTNPGIQLL
jgi:hypothetical protein